MTQITTAHVQEWDTDGYKWEQGADGAWHCVEVECLSPEADAIEIEEDAKTDEIMTYRAPAGSGLQYAGGLAKEPA
jgi:hypothetical protein